jgi:hypothetical protein
MNHELPTAHIAPEELTDYFATLLSEDREEEIEEHLADCTQCTEEARQLHAFTSIWNRWTARAHGEAYQRVLLARALQQVQARVQNPGWRRRLAQWRQDLASSAGAAIRIALKAGEDVSRIVTERLEALVSPPLQPAPTYGTVRTRGVRTRGTSAARTTVPLTPENPQARVELRGEHGEVEVCVEQLPPRQPSPLVLLIPTTTEGEPRIQELQRQENGAYVARFEGVEPGDYLVAFEPAR